MRIIAVILVVIGCLAFVALLEMDISRTNFSTLSAAQSGKSWLPVHVLPLSARDIEETHQLDLNSNTGGFDFSPEDADRFFSRLSPSIPTDVPFVVFAGDVRHHVEKGGSAWSYEDVDDRSLFYVFLCTKERDHCRFYGWPHGG